MEFTQALRSVRASLAEGRPFERIEAEVEDFDLDEDLRAVLWLYLWLGGEPGQVADELGRAAMQGERLDAAACDGVD